MTIKNYFSLSIITVVFIGMIIVGSNLSIIRLSQITGKSITPPFQIDNTESKKLTLSLLGESYSFTVSDNNSIQAHKASIQKMINTVKFTLVARIEYLGLLWSKGLNKLLVDIRIYLKILR